MNTFNGNPNNIPNHREKIIINTSAPEKKNNTPLPPYPWESLLQWHRQHGRHQLPWRQYFHQAPKERIYKIWLSEILLQQTQVTRVIEYFSNILHQYPTIKHLAQSTYEQFFPFYQGLGYYSRARNILKCAHIIHTQYQDIFPNDHQQLLSLPGIGEYTASAIRAFGYNTPIIAFDTNAEKIFSRYYFGTKYQKLSSIQKQSLQKQIHNSPYSGRDINAAIMDFASLISLNNREKINFPNASSILPNDIFFSTYGEREIQNLKKPPQKTPNQYQLIAILHRNHTQYFSQDTTQFSPFIFPQFGGNHREFLKKYFLEKYQLHISVRPYAEKGTLSSSPNTHYALCYIQIQTGENPFSLFEKKHSVNWKKNNLTKI